MAQSAGRRGIDPRIYQIATLASLLIYGMGWLDFEIGLRQAVVTLACALGTQWACTRIWGLPGFDPMSALISGLSLCLLLRTNSLALAAMAAVAAIGSKFVLRWRGKHLFNPTNFGIVAMIVLTGGQVWVSPGQWGNVAFFGFLMACLGGWVVTRASRADITLTWMGTYIGLLLARSWWLGEPPAIPFHRVQSGALLLFAFFMISDPKTTPDSRLGRIVFAIFVACGAWWIQFRLFHTNGMLWALGGCAILVPLIDWLLPAKRYSWSPRARLAPIGGGMRNFLPMESVLTQPVATRVNL